MLLRAMATALERLSYRFRYLIWMVAVVIQRLP
jgi:hypothetical protein